MNASESNTKIVELESRIAWQESHIDALTRESLSAGKRIAALERVVRDLSLKIAALTDTLPLPGEEKPPHY